MRSPTLRYVIVLVFVLVLIPSVIIPFIKKQNELQTDVSEYEEILSAIDEQTKNDTKSLYDQYKQSVLGTNDSKIDNEEHIQNILEDVDEIVDDFDLSKYKKIDADTSLPIIDLSKSNTFKYSIGDNNIEVQYDKLKEYDEPLKYIFMHTALLFENSKVCDVQIRETGDFDGNLSLHIFNNSDLTYPIMLVGTERIASYRDIYSLFCLIDNQLVKYSVLDQNREPTELRSTLDIDMYIKDKIMYIFTYWEDPALIGTKKTLWLIDHDSRNIIRNYSVLDISD